MGCRSMGAGEGVMKQKIAAHRTVLLSLSSAKHCSGDDHFRLGAATDIAMLVGPRIYGGERHLTCSQGLRAWP
jgi:hypothetical protein